MKNRLRVLRAERGWSQADLAEHLAVARQSVNAIETGRFDPSLPLAFRIARLFSLRVEEVFDDEANLRGLLVAPGSSEPDGSSGGETRRERT